MLNNQAVLATLRMVNEENLDVRTCTMGINLNRCANPDPKAMLAAVYERLMTVAKDLVKTCNDASTLYGVNVVNKRISISPASILLESHTVDTAVELCKVLDRAASELGVDLLGGFSALVHKGITPGERTLIESLPRALAETTHVCSSINVGTTRAGINVDAVNLIAQKMLEVSAATKSTHGFGCAKLVVFANITEDNPFMAGTVLGAGEPEIVINAGVSGPGVVKCAVEKLVAADPSVTLDEIAEEIKHTTYRVTRTGELIGRHVAKQLGVPFGVLDLSLAPTPKVGDSVGEIYQAMGIKKIGCPGTIAAVMMLNDAVKKGG
ncbi:MAG: DUF711 family protein, partial [Kiritimatiellia bacterium]